MRWLLFLLVFAVTTVAALVLAMTSSEAGGGGGHGCPAAKQMSGDSLQVDIVQSCFQPTVRYVPPGATVRWRNGDPLPHNVVAATANWSRLDLLDAGKGVAYSFQTEGVYPYFCSLHPGMVGVIVVDAQIGVDEGFHTDRHESDQQRPGADQTQISDPPTAGTTAASPGGESTAVRVLPSALGIALVAGIVGVAGGLRLGRRQRRG